MRNISTNKAPEAVGPYSQAVVSNGFVFTAGQIPLRTDGTMVNGNIEEQTKQVLENIKAVLEGAGSSIDKVVKTTVFLIDLGDFEKMNEVYARTFTRKPARSTVQVSALPKGASVEMDAVMIIREVYTS